MINFKAITKGKFNTSPYKWGVVESIWSDEKTARTLVSEFPTEQFNYHLYGAGFYLKRTLVKLNGKKAYYAKSLPDSFVKLADDLVSDTFRQAVETFTGLSLKGHPMEAVLFRTGHFTSYSVHDDNASATVRMTFYLNNDWTSGAGGELMILKNKEDKTPTNTVQPKLGTAAIIVRSDDSWHNISPVDPKFRDSRNTVVVTFYKPKTTSTRK